MGGLWTDLNLLRNAIPMLRGILCHGVNPETDILADFQRVQVRSQGGWQKGYHPAHLSLCQLAYSLSLDQQVLQLLPQLLLAVAA